METGIKCPDGPQKTFDDLWREYYARIHYFFRRRGLSPEDSSDLTQEVFLRVFRSSPPIEFLSISAWIFTIAMNVHRNHLRYFAAKRRSSAEEPIAMDGEDEENANQFAEDAVQEQALIARELSSRLAAAMSNLPPRMRQTLNMRLDGRSYAEIAILMDVSIEGVKSQLRQARRRLSDDFDCKVKTNLQPLQDGRE